MTPIERAQEALPLHPAIWPFLEKAIREAEADKDAENESAYKQMLITMQARADVLRTELKSAITYNQEQNAVYEAAADALDQSLGDVDWEELTDGIVKLREQLAAARVALVDARVHLVCETLPGAYRTGVPLDIIDKALAGGTQALEAHDAEKRKETARKVLLEVLSHESQDEYGEMVVSVESIRAIEAALEDVEDVT